MANPSNKDRLILAAARPIAHPSRYRTQLRIAGGGIVIAAAVYLIFGSLALFGLMIIGGVIGRYIYKGSWRVRR